MKNNQVFTSWPTDFIGEGFSSDEQHYLSPRERLFKRVQTDAKLKSHLELIAAKNAWNYSEKNAALNEYDSHGSSMMYPTWKFAIQSKYDYSICTHVLEIPTEFNKAYFFTYEYFGSDSKNSTSNNYAYSKACVLQIELPVSLPQILLDSKRNEGALLTSTYNAYSENQLTMLEGDFSDYFRLYVPKNTHIDALTLLAPNAMQLLIDSFLPYDVEFYGNKLFIFTNNPAYSEKHIHQMLTAAKAFQLYINSGFTKSRDASRPKKEMQYLQRKVFSGPQFKIGKYRISLPLILVVIFLSVCLFLLVSARNSGPDIYISPEDRRMLNEFNGNTKDVMR